jgi:circadian clock protein KaiB
MARQKVKDGGGRKEYMLRLFVTGATARSTRAIMNIKRFCEKYLAGRYHLDVIDIYQHPLMAKQEQILAAPTLVKSLPLPLRRFIGDLSSREKLLAGFGIGPLKAEYDDETDSGNIEKSRF